MPDFFETRTDLFFRTGWILATGSEYPAIGNLAVVQRFKSKDGSWLFEVSVGSEGLSCDCPGWRKRSKCWHMGWVLRWNFSGSEVGRFLTRLPDSEDMRRRSVGVTPEQWFDHHLAVVPVELAPPRTLRTKPGRSAQYGLRPSGPNDPGQRCSSFQRALDVSFPGRKRHCGTESSVSCN